MSDLNNCAFTGNIGKTPELSYTPSGVAVCKFSLAVGKQWKKDGQKEEKTTWLNCVAWKGLGETIAKHLDKGAKVAIVAEFESREYTDRDGNRKWANEFVVKELTMCGGRGNGQPARESGSESKSRSESTGGGGDVYPPFDPLDEIPFKCHPDFMR